MQKVISKPPGHFDGTTSATTAPTVDPIDSDPSTWRPSEVIRRCQSLGAADSAIDACFEDASPKTALLTLLQRLEPPSPLLVSYQDLAVTASASAEEIAAKLEKYGACVVERLAPAELIDSIDAQLTAANAWSTQYARMGMDCLVKAPLVAKLLEHDLVLAAVRKLLGVNCREIALKLLEVFQVQPGGREQLLHREDGLHPWNHQPHHWMVDMIWAFEDFTAENGATRLIPYSQFWRRSAENERPELTLQAEMPRGSVLLFTGATLHGGGRNSSDKPRKSLLSGYLLGWLRSEHRFWSYKPLQERINDYSDTMQILLGYGEPPQRPGVNKKRKLEESWVRGLGNSRYLKRSAAQVALDKERGHSQVGNLGFDECFYSSPFWAKELEDPDNDGDYITRLRARRPWTMSPEHPRISKRSESRL
eukprot:TRINITY_DN114847_c0_g1_i1.p1 TRINITY_DN114847_c0_g1~~TRINITY_DN114847_c0_g1_i1.p1  ORF type:complete len:421 (+),score=57.66 TRINITY_DN114847_c0_g1_i1:115-1377(+)